MTNLGNVTKIGTGLSRPESVLANRQGDFFVSHRGHGVCRIAADGKQYLMAPYSRYLGEEIIPNGIALLDDGSFLIANISDAGGIHLLDADGIRPFVTEIEGDCCPPVNFVTVDETDRIWFTVSSTFSPRHLAYRRDIANGFIGVIENGVARIVASGLHYVNEIRPDPENGWLYVNETFAQKISRFQLNKDGSLGRKEDFCQFPKGAFVDGISLDRNGNILAACIVSNELYHVQPNSRPVPILAERIDEWIVEVELALDNGEMNRIHFDQAPTKILRNIASVAFHGNNLDQLVCGCLLGDHLVSIPAPVKGRQPVHWNVISPEWGKEFNFQEGSASS
ncbi:MAG: SMP-30/gluconolactonase/LRE family protein [Cohaesibacteraceae bacterium]|nr:SMP-30/gluconolactonase/LRE family protein [Cohaesibacteraceae bacterium]